MTTTTRKPKRQYAEKERRDFVREVLRRREEAGKTRGFVEQVSKEKGIAMSLGYAWVKRLKGKVKKSVKAKAKPIIPVQTSAQTKLKINGIEVVAESVRSITIKPNGDIVIN